MTWTGFTSLAAGFTLAAAPGFSQAVNPGPLEDEPLLMSPFEVNTEQDTGYLASGVQSGTRLRTDLKDIASSISVVTKDFMDDIAANNLEGLLIYTLGTEVGGAGGNFADAGVVDNPNGQEVDYDAAFSSAVPSTRVRGLTKADISRDFFITSTPMDGYNTERVEISRGANAMLFGLGSPSGIINSSLSQANLNRRITELEFQTDKHGSFRTTLDHNQVLIPGKLALRVAGLYEDEKFKVEEAFSKDRRVYVTGAWRPFRNTTFRANYEKGNIDSNLPEIRPPGDAITYWWDLGKPAYDPSKGNAGAHQLLGTVSPGWPSPISATNAAIYNTNIVTTVIGAIGGGNQQMLLVYNDPNSSRMSIGIPGRENIQGMRGPNIANVHPNAAGTTLTADGIRGLREMNSILNRVVYAGDITANYWKATQITDPGIYDFYHHMLHGSDKREFADWDTFNITGEQLFLDGKAGIEVAYNHERLDNGSAMPLDSTISGYTLRLDINTHLPDGTPNPNFGRPFTTAYSRSVVKWSERDVVRATGFYDLDLRDAGPEWLGKFLGTHRFQAAHSRQETSAFTEAGNFYFNSGTDYSQAVWGTVRTASSAQRGAPIMRYLGPSVANASSAAALIGGIQTPVSQFPNDVEQVNLLWYTAPTSSALSAQNQWEVRPFGLASADLKDPSEVRRDNLRYTKEEVNSTVGILQSRFFSDNLVTTVGARRDHVLTYDAGRAPLDPVTGTAIIEDFYPLPVSNLTEDNVNWGAVLHSPDFIDRHLPYGTEISVFYNQAENFAPAGQRYDLFDNNLPHETGETEDYGVMISTFNGKLILRAAKYETISGLSSTLGNLTTPLNNLADFIGDVQEQILRGRNVLNPVDEPNRVWDPAASIAAWNQWYNSPTGVALRNTFRVVEHPNTTDPNLSTVDSDRRSGEVVAPSDVKSTGEEYELIFNPNRNWRIAFNAARAEAVRSNVATQLRDIVFNELVPLMAGPAGELESATGETHNVASNRFTGQIYNQMLPRLAEEGLPTNELREWRWNLTTNYTFTEGRLDGFNVGLGVRWQDKAAIGAPIIQHEVFGPAPDVNNPYYAPSETNYDAWIGYRKKFERFTWKVQLNVRNIGVGNELIPIAAQPDGSISGWRIAPSQSWTLRSTFSF